jgi:Kef-type K+ transport system membrane component KefB
MSPILQLLFELALLIAAAKLAGLLSTRLGQPAVLGELLAGLILGPSLLNIQGWPVFSSPHLEETISEIAEIGVILLMFLAGLEVDLKQMQRAGKVVLLAGVLGVIVPLIMGFATALPFGFDLVPAIAVGLLLTATSVSISAQTLLELGRLRSRVGVAMLGAAVVDDIVVIVAVSLFVALARGTAGVAGVAVLLLRVVLFLAVFGALGWFLVPKLLDRVDSLPISQGVLAASVVLAFLFAWAAEYVGEVALITGAFMAGVFAARSKEHYRIFEGVSALTYGFFLPIFFINIGLHANVRELQGQLLLFTLVLSLVAIVSKVIGAGLGARLGGFDDGESLRLGIGMISRGEVGLIVASILVASTLVAPEIISVAVVVVLVTTLVTPPLLRAAFDRAEAKPAVEGAA